LSNNAPLREVLADMENYRGFTFDVFQPRSGINLIRGRRIDGAYFYTVGKANYCACHFDTEANSDLAVAEAEARAMVDAIVAQ
jgi:hypothetical protein